MRDLTEAERANLGRRKARFDAFLEERMPVLVDFVERLGLPNAPMVLVEANSFLPAIGRYMENQQIGHEDRTWILTRIGYFVGEWFVQQHGGCWYSNQAPDSRCFLRYVVGKFARIPNKHAMIDPFSIAEMFVDSPCPRSLVSVLADVESELTNC
jgi:hypothetical protein